MTVKCVDEPLPPRGRDNLVFKLENVSKFVRHITGPAASVMYETAGEHVSIDGDKEVAVSIRTDGN